MKNIIENGIDIAAKLMLMDAITAPKGVGRDDIIVKIVKNSKDIEKILNKAKQLSDETKFSFYQRDAANCRRSSHIILIGYKIFYHGFDCKFCGFQNCQECEKNGGMCAISITDAGIAIGSLVKLASILGIDNRVMLSIGQAAKEIGFFKEKIGGAYGIPFSVSTKNPFFDRK